MLEQERKLFDFMCAYAEKLFGDLPDDRLAEQPCPGMNHGAWLLGHLAIANDYGLGLLGASPRCSRQWHDDFAPGTIPLPQRSAYPEKELLLAGFRKSADAFRTATECASADRLTGENPFDFLRGSLPTTGDLIAHLLTTHLSLHLGQASAWRRALGLSSTM